MIKYILRNSHISLFLKTIFFDFCDQYIRLFRANGRIFYGQLLFRMMIQVVLHMIEKPPYQRQRGIEPFVVTLTFQSRACIDLSVYRVDYLLCINTWHHLNHLNLNIFSISIWCQSIFFKKRCLPAHREFVPHRNVSYNNKSLCNSKVCWDNIDFWNNKYQ